FTGPPPTTVIHNYIDGGTDGKTPSYLNSSGTDGNNYPIQGNRTAIIPVPDQIGSIVNNKAKLYFTSANCCGWYKWASGDNIMFNGTRYNLPNPFDNIVNPPAIYVNDGLGPGQPISMMIE